MSAFVCILDRSGADLEPGEVERLAAPLELAGGALSSFCRGPVALAVRHPADPSPRQRYGPLSDPESGAVVAVAGRFHRLDESAGGGSAVGDRGPSCAASALDALRRHDEGFLAARTGSFALITADPGRCRLSLARDHLGARKVYYFLDARWLIAASEPTAILRHRAVADDLDEVAAARFLGFRFSQSERSFFRHIRELPPAHRLRVTGGDSRADQYWRFRPAAEGEPAPERVRRGFVGHLQRSLTDQTADLRPHQVALSLSGGLDSATLAALAPPGTRLFCWRFRETPECDESPVVKALAEYLGRPVHWVDGDGLHPLGGDYVDRFVHSGSPHLNAFAALKRRLYRAARAAGCLRIMVGDSGDALYEASEYWLRDALTRARPWALASLARTVAAAAAGDRFARLGLRRLLPLSGLRRWVGRQPLPWLTDLGRSRLPEPRLSPILPRGRRQRRYDLCVGAKHTELMSEEGRLFARCGVGRSDPYWYWPLLEMVIHLPAWWLHRDGRSKVLTREAMSGRLPEPVREGGTAGLLGSFFLRGIELRRRELRQQVFRRPRSDWQRWVRRSWLEPYLEATGAIAFGHTILWRVISYELWTRRLIGS